MFVKRFQSRSVIQNISIQSSTIILSHVILPSVLKYVHELTITHDLISIRSACDVKEVFDEN